MSDIKSSHRLRLHAVFESNWERLQEINRCAVESIKFSPNWFKASDTRKNNKLPRTMMFSSLNPLFSYRIIYLLSRSSNKKKKCFAYAAWWCSSNKTIWGIGSSPKLSWSSSVIIINANSFEQNQQTFNLLHNLYTLERRKDRVSDWSDVPPLNKVTT